MTLAPPEGPSRASAALRWTMAGALVVAAHAGAGWWVVTHPVARAAPPDGVQGITIDLEPVAVPQNAPQPNATMASGAAPAPQAAAAPNRQPMPPPPPDSEPPPPEAVPEPPPVVDSVPAPPSETPPLPRPPVESRTDAVLPPPPKPRPKPLPAKPDPRAVALEAATRRAAAERREAQRAARAEARTQAVQSAAESQTGGGRSAQAEAPSSASSGAAVSTWRGEVVAHLNAYKPASPNGASGTARVAFVVDRTGRVVSASLAGSSGDAALDEAAVAMVRRASPVPAPPSDLGGRVSLSVPVRFH